MSTFTLDARLAQDSLHIADLTLCQVRLSRDARYPWAILIPRCADTVEIYDLSTDDQATLWREASRLGQAMMQHFEGDKLNIASLGNLVAQFHLHVIVRFAGDAAWPGPVWGQGEAERYTENGLSERRDEIAALVASLDL